MTGKASAVAAAALALLLVGVGEGATLGTSTMLFFNAGACPAGFTTLASANQGRVFLGESGTSGMGAQNSVCCCSLPDRTCPARSTHRGGAACRPESLPGWRAKGAVAVRSIPRLAGAVVRGL
jgi:hypothetical protein